MIGVTALAQSGHLDDQGGSKLRAQGGSKLRARVPPPVEHRGMDPVLVTQVRNGGVFEKMEPKNGDLLLSCEAIADFLGHGKTSTRDCSLFEQTVCHISTEAKQGKATATTIVSAPSRQTTLQVLFFVAVRSLFIHHESHECYE